MTEEPRVLELLGPSTGGIRRHVAFLTEELRRRGWRVATAGPAGVLDGLIALDHVVEIPPGLAPGRIPAVRRTLRDLIAGYDLVHAHGLTAGWLASLARRRGQPPVVVTAHNLVLDDVAGRATRPLRVLERRLPRRVDAVVAVSPEVADRLRRRGASPITIIGALGPPPRPVRSAAATRADLGVDPAEPLVVCVARLHPQKGVDVLITAMAGVRDRVADVRLAIVGEGPLAADLRTQVAGLGLDDSIVFAPPDNPADELRAADVVVVPSRWESGPLVLGEAMLLGRPVVATPVGTVTDLVTDGETGWLVPVDDAPALSTAIAHALVDRGEATSRALAGQTRALATIDVDQRVSLVEDVYRASLGGP